MVLTIQKSWSSAVALLLMVVFLLFSQLTLAKDRIQYHVQNFDGSTIKVFNEQGVVTQSYQYAPFGQQLQLKKPSNLKNPNAFVGGVQDADDLVYLKARHYNPVLGRFYQPDPVTFIMKGHGQTNRYQYGWNDSYSFKDSTGRAVELSTNVKAMWIGGLAHRTLENWVNNLLAIQNPKWKAELTLDYAGRGRADLTYWDVFRQKGAVWELKIVGWDQGQKLMQSINQIQGYMIQSSQIYGGQWTSGTNGGLPKPFTSLTLYASDGINNYQFNYFITNINADIGLMLYSYKILEDNSVKKSNYSEDYFNNFFKKEVYGDTYNPGGNNGSSGGYGGLLPSPALPIFVP